VKIKMSELKIEKKSGVTELSFSQETLDSMQGIVLLEFSVKPDEIIKKGQKLFVTESMKGTMEIESPVEGTIKEINKKASEDTDKITSKTWLVKIK